MLSYALHFSLMKFLTPSSCVSKSNNFYPIAYTSDEVRATAVSLRFSFHFVTGTRVYLQHVRQETIRSVSINLFFFFFLTFSEYIAVSYIIMIQFNLTLIVYSYENTRFKRTQLSLACFFIFRHFSICFAIGVIPFRMNIFVNYANDCIP